MHFAFSWPKPLPNITKQVSTSPLYSYTRILNPDSSVTSISSVRSATFISLKSNVFFSKKFFLTFFSVLRSLIFRPLDNFFHNKKSNNVKNTEH